MRIFVAGASGAIGRPLVPKLLAAGHEVTGMTRSEESAERIRAAGADAAVVDVFDREALDAAVAEARAEVLVHELTSLPDRLDFRKQDIYEPTNRVRTEGTRNLLDAARAAGARRIVAQSIAFAYRPEGARVKTEDDPLMESAPGPFGGGVRSLREMESMVLGADGLDGLVLRYGFFYGPGTYYADDGTTTADVRRRRMPIVGKGTGVFSFVHVEDAADATVAAVERGAPGIYNITDDDPAAMSEWLPAFAEAAGAKRPLRVPVWLARFVGGREVPTFALELRGASNEEGQARARLGAGPPQLAPGLLGIAYGGIGRPRLGWLARRVAPADIEKAGMLFRLSAVSVAVLSAALTFASGAGATTVNETIPVEEFPAADLCNGDQILLQGTLHFVQQGEPVADAPRQHTVGHINSQRLSGISVVTGRRYNVNLIQNNIFNAWIDGVNVTTIELMLNVVAIGSEANSQLQTVLHTTFNAKGQMTTEFQNFHVHCQSDA